MNYESIYNQDYFSGKNSFFYKLGYGNFSKWYFNSLYKDVKPYAEKLKGKATVLDVGCAYGFMLEKFPKNFEKYGVDVSKYAIEKAKKNLPNADLQIANAEEYLPFSENYFDIITCNDVIEHLKNPEKLLANIYKVLKTKGILYINTPNLNWLRKNLFSLADKKEHHISLMNQKNLLQLLEKFGFTTLTKWTYINPHYGRFNRFKSQIGTEQAVICEKKP